jgi:hypothetical protein
MNRGGVGARSLNVELQKALNPANDRKVERFGWTFARGDNESCILHRRAARFDVNQSWTSGNHLRSRLPTLLT